MTLEIEQKTGEPLMYIRAYCYVYKKKITIKTSIVIKKPGQYSPVTVPDL